MTDIETERAKFEAWMWTHVDTYHRPLNRYPGSEKVGTPNGEYMKLRVQCMWESWLARAAVPVEVSEEMVEAGCRAWQKHLLSDDAAWDHNSPEYQAIARETMRVVLAAALSVNDRPAEETGNG